MILHIYIH